MKKLFSLLSITILSAILIACGSKNPVLTIMVPSGSPALAQLYLQSDTEHYQIDIVNGSDPLVAAFGSGSHDVIFAPTNLGAKLYNAGTDYLFAGTIVWGNYYLVTKGDAVFDLSSLAGKTIVVFGQNQTSDVILRYILAENEISATLVYVDAVATAAAQFLHDETLIIMTAEPTLSVLAAEKSELDVIDLQVEYQQITGSDSYPQAGVFVKSTLADSFVEDLLADLADSIDRVNDDPTAAAQLAISLGYAFSEAVLFTAIPNSHLIFADAQDSRDRLEAYFEIIMAFNPALVGGALPDDAFYVGS